MDVVFVTEPARDARAELDVGAALAQAQKEADEAIADYNERIGG